MADTKISNLAAVTTLGDTDEAVLAVGGASKKITGANIRASAFDATAPSTQAIGDSAVVGTATTAAHRDHKHAMPAFATPAIVLGSAAAAGSAGTLVRSDGTIAAFDATSPTNQAFGDAAAVGTAAFAARRDHKHAMPADPFTGAAAGGDLTGTYPNPTIGAAKVVGSNLEVVAQSAMRRAVALNGRGLLCENIDLATSPANISYTSQRGYFFGNLGILNGDTVVGVVLSILTAAVGVSVPTGAYVGLYNAAGTQLAVSSNLNSSALWKSTGFALLPFSSPYSAVADIAVYAALLINGAWQTTQASFFGGNAGIKNIGTKISGKMAVVQTVEGISTLPTPTATPADSAVNAMWCGLY
jgi:hypothetical protein